MPIYVLYIRSIVEQNVAVWNHSITQKEFEDIEWVQKVAIQIILKENYKSYEISLNDIGL